MYFDRRGDGARDGWLGVAGAGVYLHAGIGVGGKLHHLPGFDKVALDRAGVGTAYLSHPTHEI